MRPHVWLAGIMLLTVGGLAPTPVGIAPPEVTHAPAPMVQAATALPTAEPDPSVRWQVDPENEPAGLLTRPRPGGSVEVVAITHGPILIEDLKAQPAGGTCYFDGEGHKAKERGPLTSTDLLRCDQDGRLVIRHSPSNTILLDTEI